MSIPNDKKEPLFGKFGGTRPQFWKSFEELADAPDFRKFIEDEFPNRVPDWNDPASRRTFLSVMGASIVMAGAAGCTKQPREAIVPYVKQPEDLVPGEPRQFASTMNVSPGGLGTGVLVTSHEGRPTKIEGNPDHPASLGATDVFIQASVLSLYDPDRSQTVLRNGYFNSWGNFITALLKQRADSGPVRGAGIRILTGTITSPTLSAQINEFLKAYPEARWHEYEPCARHAAMAGSLAAFGAHWNTIYRFDRANVVLSLDSDFLCSTMPGGVRYARDLALRRRASVENGAPPPRIYVAEPSLSHVGSLADHRVRMQAGQVEAFASALAAQLGVAVPGGAPASPIAQNAAIMSAITKDLNANRGASIVIAGEQQPPRTHVLAHAINARLGNNGKTVIYTDAVEAHPSNTPAVDQIASLSELTYDMRRGAVTTLLILGGNPVYDAPADLDFLSALQRVPFRASLGLYVDETAEHCHWHIPQAHYLESWSDARAFDGTASILQPLIEPLYGGKTPHQILSLLTQETDQAAYETVRAYWMQQKKFLPKQTEEFEKWFRTTLHDGVVAGSAFPEKMPPAVRIPQPKEAPKAEGIEVVFRPDPAVADGRFANNAWLQEMPKPQNKVTWENSVWISPESARKYRLELGDVVALSLRGRTIKGPVWILPGHADDSVTIHFGYGRTRAGRVGNELGFNAYALWTTNSLWHAMGGSLRPLGTRHRFATTQSTQSMEERRPVRIATYEEARNPQGAGSRDQGVPKEESLFPVWKYTGYKWGMAIDLSQCMGCQACTIACQAENNIAIVGREEVAKGRHMNWLRVDRYYEGTAEDPALYFQPVPCMHCENAPCELVCPVAATVHSVDGLNEMVYNRCVGTRYCSNNCPYKVRRFNFLLYSDWYTESLKGVRNPDVTVRSRGVMEKCTYCVQRINRAKIQSEKEGRRIADGEVVTACAQACPAEAIVFGDLNDPKSKITKLQKQWRNYYLLEDLNTRPRTSYQARLKNTNPEWPNT